MKAFFDDTDNKYKMTKKTIRYWYKLLGEYTTTGTSSLTISNSNTTCLIEAVSAGSGGIHIDHLNAWHSYYVGATGGYFKGLVNIPIGTHTINIGAGGWSGSTNSYVIYPGGDTVIGSLFTLSGGSENSGGTLTVSTGVDKTYAYNQGYPLQYKGANRDWYPVFATQPAPVPSSLTSYGFGGSGGTQGVSGTNGGNGYLKITAIYNTEPLSYDYYEDVDEYYAINI